MSSAGVPRRPAPVPAVPANMFDAAGPVVSVQLTTEGSLPQAASRVALRWKTLRAELCADGAPEAALAAIDPFVDDAHGAGETLFAVSGREGLRYHAHLPQLPETDRGWVGPLPHLVPLLDATQKAAAVRRRGHRPARGRADRGAAGPAG